MTPREFEEAAAAHYREQGYEVELGPYTRDWGIDAIAIKGTNRVAIQAKMYGGSTRLVSREQVMQLHGAAAYFGCTRAVIATDGSVAPDARLVADKLKIAILDLARPVRSARKARIKHEPSEFDGIWTRYIMPLASRTLSREDGSSNEIVAVDWGGVTRMTSVITANTSPSRSSDSPSTGSSCADGSREMRSTSTSRSVGRQGSS